MVNLFFRVKDKNWEGKLKLICYMIMFVGKWFFDKIVLVILFYIKMIWFLFDLIWIVFFFYFFDDVINYWGYCMV